MSVTTTLRAPMCRTIAAAITPIGPAPVISTSSPTTSKRSAVWVALPNGSSTAATLSSMCAGTTKTFCGGDHDVLGERARAGDADAGVVVAELAATALAVAAVPTGDVTLAGDPLTDLEPDDIGAERLDLAHELVADHHRHGDRRLRPRVPSRMCRSVPQIDVLRTRISTSRSPGAGLATSSIHSPGSRRALTSALTGSVPSPGRPRTNASTAWSMSASVCAADIWVRMRALPWGTTGKRERDHVDALRAAGARPSRRRRGHRRA